MGDIIEITTRSLVTIWFSAGALIVFFIQYKGLSIQKAMAEGIKMLKDAGVDDKVVSLKILETFTKVADGKATKIIIPSEIQNMAGLITSLKEIVDDEED